MTIPSGSVVEVVANKHQRQSCATKDGGPLWEGGQPSQLRRTQDRSAATGRIRPIPRLIEAASPMICAPTSEARGQSCALAQTGGFWMGRNSMGGVFKNTMVCCLLTPSRGSSRATRHFCLLSQRRPLRALWVPTQAPPASAPAPMPTRATSLLSLAPCAVR